MTTSSDLLDDIIASGRLLLNFTDGRNFEDYRQDVGLRYQIERGIEILGEQLNRLRTADEKAFEAIAGARQAIGLRNRLAHGYDDDIDDAIVWNSATHDIPHLIESAEKVRQRS